LVACSGLRASLRRCAPPASVPHAWIERGPGARPDDPPPAFPRRGVPVRPIRWVEGLGLPPGSAPPVGASLEMKCHLPENAGRAALTMAGGFAGAARSPSRQSPGRKHTRAAAAEAARAAWPAVARCRSARARSVLAGSAGCVRPLALGDCRAKCPRRLCRVVSGV
jgi:hypothetical protein